MRNSVHAIKRINSNGLLVGEKNIINDVKGKYYILRIREKYFETNKNKVRMFIFILIANDPKIKGREKRRKIKIEINLRCLSVATLTHIHSIYFFTLDRRGWCVIFQFQFQFFFYLLEGEEKYFDI